MATFNQDPDHGFLHALCERQNSHGTLKLIPWEDTSTSLRVAKMRGNGEMIDVFYDNPCKEATFDDKGP